MIDELISFLAQPPFRILQISDIHWNHENNAVQQNLLKSFSQIVSDISAERNLDIIVIAGDLAAKDPANEISFAGEFIKNTLKFNGKDFPKNRLFIVLGNHEVIWTDSTLTHRMLNPYHAYVTFYNNLYGREQIIKTVATKNAKKPQIPQEVLEYGLSWHRTLKIPNVSLIGVCSNSPDVKDKGKGCISQNIIDYIMTEWSTQKPEDEMRIFILHHNFFQTELFDERDEDCTLLNAGKVLNALVNSHCDLVLSGHTHRPQIIAYQSSVMGNI